LNKLIFILSFLILPITSLSYEIVRDPITENYLSNILNDVSSENIKVNIINDQNSNAFVINRQIYVHTGLFNDLNTEDSLKSILFHELGHIKNNHYETKYESVLRAQNNSSINNIVALGLAVI